VDPMPEQTVPDLIALGGPLYQFFKFTRLLRPPFGRTGRRIAVMVVVTWVPLLVLSILHHTAVSGVSLPFLQDFQVHARFLIALPMFLLADLAAYTFLTPQAGIFISRGLIRDEDRPRYDAALKSTWWLRDWFLPELISLLIVIGFRIAFGHVALASRESSWYTEAVGDQIALTAAGRYYLAVALPILQFMLLRFLFKLLLWWRWMWKVSRLDLALIPSHPDKCGGLGFLEMSVRAFMPALFAEGALLSGRVANAIRFEHLKISNFRWEAAGLIAFLILIVLLPMTFFSVQLMRSKRAGLMRYGLLSSRYVSDFDAKWVGGGAPREEVLLGTSDIQSLADLANSFNVVTAMKVIPFGRSAIVQAILPIVAPLLPLVFTVVSVEQVLSQIVKLVL
jgi:hypothetical protein